MSWKLGTLLLSLLIRSALPAQGSELDDLVSGFASDEKPSEKGEIDDLLDGFDEQSTDDDRKAPALTTTPLLPR